MKPQIISILNHKGGVGKTTTTVNISAGLAKLGKKVLTIDLDIQMNLTHSLIEDLNEEDQNITEAILNEKVSLKAIIRKTSIDNLHIAPSGESMIDLDLQLQSAFGRENKLKNILKKDLIKEYDFIIIDNAPHIGLTTVNSLIASDYYLVPVSAEYLPLVGIKNLIKTIDRIKILNPSITNLGYLLTRVDRREGISNDIEKVLRDTFQEDVFKNYIRVNTKLKACPQKKQSIFQAETVKGKGYSDYFNVTRELIERLEKF
jgi:chromosome partitioning protein